MKFNIYKQPMDLNIHYNNTIVREKYDGEY